MTNRKKKKRVGRRGKNSLIRLETLEHRVLLAADWQNPVNQYDVDGSDGVQAVSPLDAVIVINELTTPTVSHPLTGALPELDPEHVSQFFDVTGDGYVSPMDALAVINELSDLADSVAFEQPSLQQALAADGVISGSRAALSHGVEHDTLVNSITDRNQSQPDVAAGAAGDIVVTWRSYKQDGSSWGVFAQRYDASGQKVGDEIAVNTTTRKSQRDPAVAVGDDGSFVIVWNSSSQDGSSWGVYGQRFDGAGTPVGDEFQVNVTTKGAQNRPDVAVLANGEIVVTWEGRGVGDKSGIFMRQLGLDGSTDEIRVNATTSGHQHRPVVSALPDGDFIVAWEGEGPDDSRGIYLRRVSNGVLGDQIRVNDLTSGSQRFPSVAVGPDGQYVVAWKQDDGHGSGVHAKPFDSQGLAGTEMVANQTLKGPQRGPSVAYLADGRFAISWYGRGNGDRKGTFTRTFLADGTPESGEILVNTTVESAQTRPASTAVNNGHVVAWQGRGIDDRRGVFARFFDTEPIGPFNLDPIGDQIVDEGSTVSFVANVVDLDGVTDNVTFSLGGDTVPEGATIDPTTGEFSWVTDEADDGFFEVDVIALEGDFSVTRIVEITVNEVNQAPVLDAVDDVLVSVGQPVSITFAATDADLPENELVFTVSLEDDSALPDWMSFDAETQTLSGVPSDGDEGTSNLTATVTDSGGLDDSLSFVISVVSDPFAIDVDPNQTVDEGNQLNFVASITDTDGQPDDAALSATGLPAGASFDPSSGIFSWTPGEEDGPGSVTVTITATSADFSTSRNVEITVNEVNEEPVLADIGDQTVNVGSPLALTLSATDDDLPADTLTFAVELDDSSFLSFDPSTRVLSGTPGDGDIGTTTVVATVTDSSNGTDSETFMVTVISGPFDLVISGDQEVNEGSTLTLTATVVDLDGVADNATLSATDLPPGASFNPETGVLSWTPEEVDGPGTFTVRITAAEGDFSVTKDVEITVNEVNVAPVLADIADQTVLVGESLSVGVVAIDPDIPMNDLTYVVTLADGGDLPGWLSFDAGNLILSGTPDVTDEGSLDLRVTVTDDGDLSDEELFKITVRNSTSPILTSPIPDQTVVQDDPFLFDVSPFFSDADGDALTYDAIVVGDSQDLPSWLSFSDTGVFSGTPTGQFANTTTEIQVTASDPDQNPVSDSFNLTVVPNRAPIAIEQVFRVASTAATGTEVGTFVATELEGDDLTYSIASGNPNNLFAIDADTGAITVDNAGALQAGTTETLTIDVSDGDLSTTTTATVYVTDEPVAVRYLLRAYDTSGNEISSVEPGQQIELRLFTQDVRDEARGVFSAYADIVYALEISSVAGTLSHSSTYGAATSGSTSTGGLVDEVGGVDGINDLGADEFEVVRISFNVNADARGVLHFALNVAEDSVQHPTLLFGETAPVAGERIEFGSLVLTIGNAQSGEGNG